MVRRCAARCSACATATSPNGWACSWRRRPRSRLPDPPAAIVGGIAGSGVGREGLPLEWLERLVESPRTVGWMEELARQLALARVEPLAAVELPRLPPLRLVLRNVFFLGVVLVHGF